MKQCPECREVFEEGVNFCELDGVRLVDQLTEIREIIQPPPYHLGPNVSGTVATVVIGVLIGVVLTLIGFVFFLFPQSSNKAVEKREPAAQSGLRSEQLVAAPRERPAPTPVTSPSPEASQESSPSPAPSANSSSNKEPAATMNDGPISTGTKRGPENGQAIIKMKDGSSVEADAAWEDAQGVWYRRGNMVAFVERSRVDKITAASKRAPADESRP